MGRSHERLGIGSRCRFSNLPEQIGAILIEHGNGLLEKFQIAIDPFHQTLLVKYL
jgi:hypothetical protein